MPCRSRPPGPAGRGSPYYDILYYDFIVRFYIMILYYDFILWDCWREYRVGYGHGCVGAYIVVLFLSWLCCIAE